MFGAIARKLFGTANERVVKELGGKVEAINALESSLEELKDYELRGRTDELRARLANGETLDDILVDAFATVREAAKRTLGQRHYDVQLMGGMVLHQGRIAEMTTGEGKTLVSTLAVYLNALASKGVHVVTVNDYLAQRDANWMGQIYQALGITVGCVVHGLDDEERRVAYGCDVTYGTNNEFGFDYLRDNMKFSLDTMVQRDFFYAIVDEVDSILIDEARTPLIISGPAEDSSEMYLKIDVIIPELVELDYEVDEKSRTASLTELGVEHVEQLLVDNGTISEGSLYDINNVTIVHHVNQALRAHKLFVRDADYIVQDDKVIIIDEFTGRMMEGRRYSEGLHQALEAKEKAHIQNENQTLASITFQNYFRLYEKLAGMTGTAMTEAEEFGDIYKLEVVNIPTNVPPQRIDADDEVYRTASEKYDSIIELIRDAQKRGQPVLVGTVSIEKSEHLADLLKANKIKHSVLNARYHEQEAQIIGQAGRAGAITIATNMAGRGTDIQLGGNLEMRIADENATGEKAEAITAEVAAEKEKVFAAGGLYVVGTERHESRRIDNQLRGRSGRQGDAGASKFFLSLEDDLMRIFGSERMDGMLRKLGLEDGEAIVHPWINKALEKAQQKVEARNYDIRKNLLKFDDVMNDQRKVIYEQRKDLMRTDDVSEDVADMRHDVVTGLVKRHIPEKAHVEQWETEALKIELQRVLNMELPIDEWAKEEGVAEVEIEERVLDAANRKMAEKAVNYGRELWRMVEKNLLLQLLDQHWKEHLLALDHLRQGIGLRAYGQKDPLNEYKLEAFNMFEGMLGTFREQVTTMLFHVELQLEQQVQQPIAPMRASTDLAEQHLDPVTGENEMAEMESQTPARAETDGEVMVLDPDNPSTWGKVPRNKACPCNSGKKYKHCHGKS
ncbi:MAG: preprotein translocase subunit SecA [Alphaproteobacteria bacterium]|jgi:preprotein translocase subunit SecA|nr:preprotein translocase subunit SecA [Alphaproteobacteria bacterium]MBT4082473.1 preprotein translocase subunit SecA [Alphaproteobacteria bacterium]MBT7745123.1 preprotein translocase subunit SecA [Alphaproteobacteria bacterium]